MALVKCLECGREVSDKAAACSGCGAPIGAATSTPAATTNKRKELGP
jgi:zinc-ribbon domain